MKAKRFFLPFILLTFVLPATSCSTVSEGQPIVVPETASNTYVRRGSRFISAQATAVVPQSGRTDSLELEAFLDECFTEQMSAMHVPGVTFILVKDGDILFAKGYGFADLNNQIPYDPDRTIFWAASIAKVFSVVGVLQLYEQGLIHLEDDVNRYLVDFQIPDDYPQTITFHNLLTHTDGFEARIIGDGPELLQN